MHQANLPTRIIVSLSACVCAAFAYSAGAAAAPTSYTLTDLGTLSSVHHTVSPQGIADRPKRHDRIADSSSRVNQSERRNACQRD
jgi:hypothetical protein